MQDATQDSHFRSTGSSYQANSDSDDQGTNHFGEASICYCQLSLVCTFDLLYLFN